MATIPDPDFLYQKAQMKTESSLPLSIRQFLRRPLLVGSAFPASRPLVASLLDPLDWTKIRLVVEYGAGTGPLTRGALARMPEDGRLVAMDIDADFTRHLRRTIADPRLTAVTASAASVGTVLAEHGFGHADLIITGIPFSTLSMAEGQAVLDRSIEVLDTNGTLAAYQMRTTVGGLLAGRFRQIRKSFVWRNIPPCHLYWAEKPAGGHNSGESVVSG